MKIQYRVLKLLRKQVLYTGACYWYQLWFLCIYNESRSRYTFYNSYEKRNHGNPTVIGEDLLIRNNGKNQAINKIIESAKCEQQTSSNFDQKKSQCRAEITVCVASWHHSKKRME